MPSNSHAHGTFGGDDFYFLSSNGWNEYERDGTRQEGSKPLESEVRILVLGFERGR